MKEWLVRIVYAIEKRRALSHLQERARTSDDPKIREKYAQAYSELRQGKRELAYEVLKAEMDEVRMLVIILLAKGMTKDEVYGLNCAYSSLSYMVESVEPAA